ncbi:TetR/AcrR family fatty acid metabolism transcriptional regulator [Cerasibacillus quisquiliarum]|uniref:Fatty acid metabolism regulator protein n=1 Tax=Cerasibacillus quisquiliarum TaxID=227865 RepID=A0A511V0J8_9BACI|nr:TetR/AcrR family transcriptional regulator [Cerasibacillus quisquiliarum]MBB5145674.1 TetR/AcrR family fatty acid metabolism transcriptional regulator [Cerasibacillus quisquiliarum]GEN31468.1 fatty acid metabolism regulator protein [Cerasibacillus quisquiliarum]
MKKNRPKYKAIIDGAVQVIAENGYHASQVSKIAKKAGVADGTIYLYFKNKEDILVSVFREKMGQFIQKIADATHKEKDIQKKLLTLIRLHFEQLAVDHHLAIVTQLELRQSDPKIRQQINNVLKDYLDIIDMILKEGMEQHVIRRDLNIPLMRQMIFGTIDETVTNWVMKNQKFDLVSLAPDVHDLLMNGLSPSE